MKLQLLAQKMKPVPKVHYIIVVHILVGYIWSLDLLTGIKIHLCCPCFKFCNWVFVLFASCCGYIYSATKCNHRAE